MKWRSPLLILGIALALVGCLAPRDWYDAIPRSADLPDPPIKGVTLLQISLVIEGLGLVWLSLNRWDFTRLSPPERLPATGAPAEEADDKRLSIYLLAAITALALALRLIGVNSDLWLDEITTVQIYSQASLLHIIASYTSTNNHLLNTLLVKLAVAWAGNQEWAIRLPAALFGVVTIPAFYWVARLALSRRASLCAALLLTVSYHHIFFSQTRAVIPPTCSFRCSLQDSWRKVCRKTGRAIGRSMRGHAPKLHRTTQQWLRVRRAHSGRSRGIDHR